VEKKTLGERAESGLTYRFYAASPYQLFVIQTHVIASPGVDLSRPRRLMSRDLLGPSHRFPKYRPVPVEPGARQAYPNASLKNRTYYTALVEFYKIVTASFRRTPDHSDGRNRRLNSKQLKSILPLLLDMLQR
jgi:hypothetical protein